MTEETTKQEVEVTEEKPQEETKEPSEEKEETKEETSTEDKDPEPVEEKQEEKEPQKEEKDLSQIDDMEEAKETLKDKGFDYVELQKEFNEKGDISKETRAKLAEQGISEEIVNNYIEGQKAKAEAEIDKLAESIGGRETFDAVLKWTGENVSPEEIQSINEVTDTNILRIILKDLKNRMEEKEGKAPEYTKGEGSKPTQDIYRSQAEMFEAITNPKYKKDEAYRKDVQKRITASREAGIDLGI